MFLNAGVGTFAPIEHTSEEQFDTMVNVNFKGTFFSLQKFIPILNDGASVIFLASGNTSLNMPNSSVYSATKSALAHLARIATIELAERNIRVNTVSPGPTQTEMQGKLGFDQESLEGMTKQIISQVPLAKMGVPEDVAKMVVYLADNETSSFITGSDFFIDGEWPYNILKLKIRKMNSKTRKIIGWSLSGLVALMLVASATDKIIGSAHALKWPNHLVFLLHLMQFSA